MKNVSGKSDVFLSVKPAKKVVQNELAKSNRPPVATLPLTRVASVSVVKCEQVKSASTKLGVRERKKKKDVVGGSFFDIFGSRPNFRVLRMLSY